jgi:DNA-binding NarL/FixJ family response regulator
LILNDEDDAATLAAFRGGAWAVLSRSRTNLVVISECILRINGGEMWVTPRQTRLLVDALSASQSPPASQPVVSAGMGLTVREQQVLRSLADGMSNREIALHLGVSEHTVKNHLFRIFDKLGVSTRLEAALFAVSDVPTRTRIECEPLETIA